MASERYVFQKHIDDGGQGSVSLYQDNYLDRKVAVKTIKIDKHPEALDEVNMMKSVVSKHVVNLYDVIQSGSTIEIYQEYLGGDDLRDKVAKCSPQEFLLLAFQLVSGLADIHNAGICHRDIKLENVKFDEQGVLKIFDFGVSREGDPHDTLNGFGTAQYLAPEVYELHHSSEVTLSYAVDIFAFGVTLHKLAFGGNCNFCGYVPGIAPSAVQFDKLGLGGDITTLLSKTLSSNPIDRPSAKDLKRYLERELLKDKHVGFFVTPRNTHQIDVSNRAVKIRIADKLSIVIGYNGYDFIVMSVEGAVYINNDRALVNRILHGACVLTFENSDERRFFVSFSSSHPEIVL
ncbi:serine/threonine-protein kinase [Vibrio parahaemolyticus]|nr:serine/threonine-protein kinase [Vibrio parahaemolyticus]